MVYDVFKKRIMFKLCDEGKYSFKHIQTKLVKNLFKALSRPSSCCITQYICFVLKHTFFWGFFSHFQVFFIVINSLPSSPLSLVS